MQLPDIVIELIGWAAYQAVDCQLAGNDYYAQRFVQIETVLNLIPAMLEVERKQADLLAALQAEIARLQTNQKY